MTDTLTDSGYECGFSGTNDDYLSKLILKLYGCDECHYGNMRQTNVSNEVEHCIESAQYGVTV